MRISLSPLLLMKPVVSRPEHTPQLGWRVEEEEHGHASSQLTKLMNQAARLQGGENSSVAWEQEPQDHMGTFRNAKYRCDSRKH